MKTAAPADAVREPWDVVIVGAGPAGSTAALLLARRRLRTLLLNREVFPRDKVCGCCLNAPAIDLLSQLDFASLIDASPELNRFRIFSGENRSELSLPSGHAISRQRLDAALTQAAIDCGATLIAPATAMETQLLDGRRLVRFNSDSESFEVYSKIVIVADGVCGTVLRRSTKFHAQVTEPVRCGISAMIGSETKAFEPGCIYMFTGNDGYLGIVRMSEDELRLAGCFSAESLRRTDANSLSALLLKSSEIDFTLPAVIRWRGTAPLQRTLKRFADERLFVIGDAASYTQPFTGEGIAWALAAAIQVAPLASAGVIDWKQNLSRSWQTLFQKTIVKRQWVSRAAGKILQEMIFRNAAIRSMVAFPQLAAPFLRVVTRHY